MHTDSLLRFECDDLEVLVLDLELDEPDLPELTPCEREVAFLVSDGLSNAEIAEARSVSVRTVANQIRSIFTKLGLSSRWDLAQHLTQRSLAAKPPPAPPAIVTTRKAAPSPDHGRLVNSASTVRVLREAYARVGVDFDQARARRGVEPFEDGALLRRDYCALFDELAAEAGRPGLGLELARTLPTGSIGLLEWLGMSAPTLGEGLAAVSEHGGLLHGGGHRVTRAAGDRLVVAYWVDGVVPPRVVTEWAFGRLWERIRAVAGPDLPLVEVRVQHEDPRDGLAEDFFGARVRYGAATNEIVLPREIADLPLLTGDPDTFAALSQAARLRLGDPSPSGFVEAVRHAIVRALEAGDEPRLVIVARSVDVSVVALDRKLAEAGACFESLVAACRLERAVRGLEGRAALDPVRDPAGLLGFAEVVRHARGA